MSGPASLEEKILFVQASADPRLRLILHREWGSAQGDYRPKIRQLLATKFAAHFSRTQLARLNDLNWIPEASDGFVSISHCRALGGFSFSAFPHGFDVEEAHRISRDVLRRTCSAEELAECGENPEFLWVAKESGLKAHTPPAPPSPGVSVTGAVLSGESPLLITDLVCTDWQSHFENQVFSFRLKPARTLEFTRNCGFIFQHDGCLFSLYFR